MNVRNISLKNLGTVNKNLVTIRREDQSPIYLYFSYETVVGIEVGGITHCRQNDWGPTTGKLLNEIEPDKTKRLPEAEFTTILNSLFTQNL